MLLNCFKRLYWMRYKEVPIILHGPSTILVQSFYFEQLSDTDNLEIESRLCHAAGGGGGEELLRKPV